MSLTPTTVSRGRRSEIKRAVLDGAKLTRKTLHPDALARIVEAASILEARFEASAGASADPAVDAARVSASFIQAVVQDVKLDATGVVTGERALTAIEALAPRIAMVTPEGSAAIVQYCVAVTGSGGTTLSGPTPHVAGGAGTQPRQSAGGAATLTTTASSSVGYSSVCAISRPNAATAAATAQQFSSRSSALLSGAAAATAAAPETCLLVADAEWAPLVGYDESTFTSLTRAAFAPLRRTRDALDRGHADLQRAITAAGGGAPLESAAASVDDDGAAGGGGNDLKAAIERRVGSTDPRATAVRTRLGLVWARALRSRWFASPSLKATAAAVANAESTTASRTRAGQIVLQTLADQDYLRAAYESHNTGPGNPALFSPAALLERLNPHAVRALYDSGVAAPPDVAARKHMLMRVAALDGIAPDCVVFLCGVIRCVTRSIQDQAAAANNAPSASADGSASAAVPATGVAGGGSAATTLRWLLEDLSGVVQLERIKSCYIESPLIGDGSIVMCAGVFRGGSVFDVILLALPPAETREAAEFAFGIAAAGNADSGAGGSLASAGSMAIRGGDEPGAEGGDLFSLKPATWVAAERSMVATSGVRSALGESGVAPGGAQVAVGECAQDVVVLAADVRIDDPDCVYLLFQLLLQFEARAASGDVNLRRTTFVLVGDFVARRAAADAARQADPSSQIATYRQPHRGGDSVTGAASVDLVLPANTAAPLRAAALASGVIVALAVRAHSIAATSSAATSTLPLSVRTAVAAALGTVTASNGTLSSFASPAVAEASAVAGGQNAANAADNEASPVAFATDLFEQLGRAIALTTPTVAKSCAFVLCPGPGDLTNTSAGALPQGRLLAPCLNAFRASVPYTTGGSNPARIRALAGKTEIVVARTAFHRTFAAAALRPEAAATCARPFEELARCIVRQGFLLPATTAILQTAAAGGSTGAGGAASHATSTAHAAVGGHLGGITRRWHLDRQLWLGGQPLPPHIAVVADDAVEPWTCPVDGINVVHPGSFALRRSFLWISPFTREVYVNEL